VIERISKKIGALLGVTWGEVWLAIMAVAFVLVIVFFGSLLIVMR